MSRRPEGGTFSAPTLVTELNSSRVDRDARLSKDGLEIFFASDRDGPVSNPQYLDIWSATRERTSDSWGAPVKLGTNVNSAAIEAVPTLSWDGMTLMFVSFRAGNPDLYQSTRTRITGRKK
jgi:Tol biopolymer transport system component